MSETPAPAAAVARDGDCLRVSGPLTMETVPAAVEAGIAALTPEIRRIDLSGVAGVDSAAVALLLEWVKNARDPVVIEGAPAPLRTLAKLYSMDGVLPFSVADGQGAPTAAPR